MAAINRSAHFPKLEVGASLTEISRLQVLSQDNGINDKRKISIDSFTKFFKDVLRFTITSVDYCDRSLRWYEGVESFVCVSCGCSIQDKAMYMQSRSFLRSLLVASLMSFIAPLLLMGLLVLVAVLSAYIPGLSAVSSILTSQILGFLSVFGSGDAIAGAVVIASACSLVGALFDTYSFYYRSL